MATNPVSIKELFVSLTQDAIIWKSQKLWTKAKDPDDQAEAMDDIVEMLACIENETKRSSYIELVQKRNKIKNNLLRKQVKDHLAHEQAKKEADIAKKKLEAKYSNTEDAGLPDGFDGDILNALKYGIYEHEGVYYTRGARGSDYPVSNFVMKIVYHVPTDDEDSFRLISITNVIGFETFINMNTDDFVSVGNFKKIIARRGNYIWKGSDSDLSRLQELLQKDELTAHRIKILGWNNRGRFYAFANGIIPANLTEPDKIEFISTDEYGIIDFGKKKYFIPALSKMYKDKDDLFNNEKKFIYRDAPENFGFRQWNELFLGAYKEKAITVTLHYIGALFFDIMHKKIQRYPILNFFGPPQAGKGKMGESVMSMFGERQDQIMLGGASTPIGFMRRFAQVKNAYVWLDEFKNTIPFKVQESIKNIYDGIGYTRGEKTNDFSTNTTPVNSACLLSGQELPTGEAALFTRIILESFDDGKNRSASQRKAFMELKDIENAGGLAFITAQIVQFRNVVEEKFEHAFKTTQVDIAKKLAESIIDDRFIDNISILLAFRKIFDKILPFAFSYEEAEKYLFENIRHHQLLKTGNDEVSKFWQVVEALFYRDEIVPEKDFKLEAGYIFLRLQQVHPLYQKEMIARRDMNYLPKGTMEHYLKLDKSIFVAHTRKRFDDGSNSSCYQLRYNKLNIDLIKVTNNALTPDQKEYVLNEKYKEMGVFIESESILKTEEEDELPFPTNK